MDTWMCASLVPERLDGFYSYFVFQNLSVIGRCPMDTKILAPKIVALQVGRKIRNGDFL
jgi:hypothetical protein